MRCRILVGLILASGCGGEGRSGDASAWRAEVDTVGDTVVVRTLAGSTWGAVELVEDLRIGVLEGADHEIFGEVAGLAVAGDGAMYVYDRQVPALRKYGADGSYLMTFGRRGGGPGEYENSDGGLAVLADGRVVLRDPGNARMNVYAADGTPLTSWPIRGGAFTSVPIIPMASGGFYNPVWTAREPMHLVRHAADGTAEDTLPLPRREVDRPTVTARRNGSSQTWPVPFTASGLWALHPEGSLTGVSSEYAIDLVRRDGTVLRFGRSGVEPVPVPAAEREAERERVTRGMRRLDPTWRWDGPAIPTTKSLIQALYAGADGRIWVLTHQPGELVAEDGGAEVTDDPGPRFREPIVFDVFEPDGRYLGQVRAPPGFSRWPQPTFRGETVWSTARGDLGVQYVVRYRIGAAP